MENYDIVQAARLPRVSHDLHAQPYSVRKVVAAVLIVPLGRPGHEELIVEIAITPMISILSYSASRARTVQWRKSRIVVCTPAVDSSWAAKGEMVLRVAQDETASG